MQMADEMGWTDIDPEELPVDVSDLCYEAQSALLLFNILPDKVEGMAGLWLGKDFSGLGDIMDIYRMFNKSEILDYLQVIIVEYSKHYESKRQVELNKSKSKVGN